ncbi:unnamed protein product [Leptidea sinapis]|uniref:Uncharacterized protein n=1 Tax=Leptidea sinapis TaxID=189913 RepID=A0A5E4PUR0_9NEOP|nr:unnamed protein product [Leptidea sinapis]
MIADIADLKLLKPELCEVKTSLRFAQSSVVSLTCSQIHAGCYQTWLRNELITNLPPNTVLVIDNAPNHNKLSVKAPNSNTPKPQMIPWLQTQYSNTMT